MAWVVWQAAVLVSMSANAADATQPPVKVGVCLRSLGAASIAKALAQDKTFTVAKFKEIDTDTLLAHDVVVIGACALDKPSQIKALRTFLACGGGLVLNHQACGRNLPETFFPTVARRVIDRREDPMLVVKQADHPLAAGLAERWEHSYHDHLFLEPGPDGTTVLVDREGAPVVVAGTVGAGRLVMNGALSGYRYDPVSYHQGEAEPQGAELRLVSNALRWAAVARLTTLGAEELAARRNQAERDLRLDDLSKLLPTADWFAPEMLRGSYLPLRPVSELGGRFFITYDRQTWRGYKLNRISTPQQAEFFRHRLRIDVQQLKWLGVTDIIYWVDTSGDRVSHDTALPESRLEYRGIDPLAELIKAATAENMNVWASWHSCAESQQFADRYCARDDQGHFYLYGGKKYCEDLLSPAYRQRCYAMLDEYAAKYKPLGNFLGLAAYDELWFTGVDFHGDDLPLLERFCLERFGEKPPADMAQRLARARQWTDTDDVWRRRYILFKQHVMTSFWRDLVEHAHRRELQVGVQLLATAYYPTGWTWGMDNVALSQLPADFFNGSSSKNPAHSYRNMLLWSHVGDSWGAYNTHCLRGGPGGIFFTFNQLWRLVMYANNPALPRELGRHIYNQRMWANSQPLARAAFLHNQNALQMLLPDARPQTYREVALFRALQRRLDGDWIFSQDTHRYREFDLLVAPPYSVRGLSPDMYGKLRAFVQDGRTLISVNSDWSVAREDLTQEQDRTADMLGVTYGETPRAAAAVLRWPQGDVHLQADTSRRAVRVLQGTEILATFADGTPAITRRPLGKGTVIGLHFAADAELEKQDNPALAACFGSLLAEAIRPAILAEGDGFRVISTLKKGNWLAVALYPDTIPSRCVLRVDTKALGIDKDGFRMLMLGKRMEIGRPGDLWGETGFWTAEELKRGFPVTLVADDDRNMPLPDNLDTSEFRSQKNDQAAYVEGVTREWWDSQTRGRRKRNYAHEIVVLAPGDEPQMK